MFQPSDLFNICKKKVMLVYKNNWTETNVLPKLIQKDLLEEWLNHADVVFSPEDAYADHLGAMNSWDDLLPICPQTFVWLMLLPQEVPSFAYEENHIIFDYYKRTNYQCTFEERLCSVCFSTSSKYYYPYSANLWLEQNNLYKHYTQHLIVNGDDLLEDVIWENKAWCDMCSTTPLFTLLNEDDCHSEHDYHYWKRSRPYDYNSDDSLGTIPSQCSETIIAGNRMSPVSFKMQQEIRKFLEN